MILNTHKKKISLLVCSLLLVSTSLFAQKGFLKGKITDKETGEALLGSTISVEGTSVGVSADLDGNYSLALEEGTHTILIQFISYQVSRVENIQIKTGEVTPLNIGMISDAAQLEEVVISGSVLKDSEAGLVSFQRKSGNVVDGISTESFKKTGDTNLSLALKRVTGVAVQSGQQGSGQYVYVRGLGDRYTRTTLNGMTIPGLDPDRNDVQIDIFPTSVLENVIVYKTSSANLPGDFTGGLVDVETKNFPTEKSTSVSIGVGFNPAMNFNSNFVTYNGGSTDFLGFDDGTRKLPFDAGTQIPNPAVGDPQLETLTRSLNPTLGVIRAKSFLNTSFAFNHTNQIDRAGHTLGYTAIFSYQNRYEYYPELELGEYTKNENTSENEFFAEEVRIGDLGRNSVLWSGLLSGAMKFGNNTISASIFRTQNSMADASERTNRNFDETGATLYENILTYSQRSVTSALFSGTHQLNNVKMEWNNAVTFARTYDPDFRTTSISITNPDEPTINRGDGAGIGRFWRDLNEFNENLKVDFTIPYAQSNKLMVGASGLYKSRDFEVLNYLVDATNRSNVPLDPDYFLRPENIWTAAEEIGTFLQGNYEAANNYQAKSTLFTGYVMTEMIFFEKIKAIYGVRLEKTDMFYTGEDIFGTQFNNERTLNEFNILPSLNLVYSLSENMNLRGSYGRTLARPSFKEKSSAQIYDPITRRFYNGNLDLEQTLIDNVDVRWENFFRAGDMISFSAFYKKFDGHIELVTYDIEPNNVKPRNAGESSVYGMEFEVRKGLDFISPALSGFSLGTNFSLAKSEVDLKSVIVNESGKTEFESRQENARTNEVVEPTREMAGQAPYLINAFINYTGREENFNVNFSYNVQGETLAVIGIGAVPDIYTQPFHSFNFNTFYNFGAEKRHRIILGVDNILKSERKDLYQGYGGADAVYSVFRPGTTYSLKYELKF